MCVRFLKALSEVKQAMDGKWQQTDKWVLETME